MHESFKYLYNNHKEFVSPYSDTFLGFKNNEINKFGLPKQIIQKSLLGLLLKERDKNEI
ncbi:hypothetical protein [Peromfec virus RodF7_15]|uniref:Uncharacterized protein n=1 Tax=Peromfec virus RodF7_15 TaxID=2929350 RepID=A0A976R7T1_9VIRU|nr:hypothetical protein [Peromfec virus RodF7_15]